MNKTTLKLTVALTLLSASITSAMAAGVKDKGTALNVTFGSFKPTEYRIEQKPNILIVVVDDLGYGQLNYDESAYNKAHLAKLTIPERYQADIDKAIAAARQSTPVLHNLQQQGIQMKQGFVAHGMSGPSRAAIMTSRAPSRYGIYSNDDAEKGVAVSETFMPEIFRNYGYATAAIGKWHMSEITNVPVDEKQRTRDYHDNFITYSAEPFQPQNRGFDSFFGYHNSGAAYYNSPSLFRDRHPTPAKGYLTDQLTDEAIKVIRHDRDKPFFLYLAYSAVHIPLEKMAPKQYQIFNTGNKEVDNYYATLNAVDQNVGRIINTLKQTGQDENTLIFFLSDNGGVIDSPLPMNGQFKANKGQTYSGGVHVPMFVYWKGHLQPGGVYNQIVSSMDIMPTALAAADIPLPLKLENKLDGVNLLPYLKGEKQNSPHEALFWASPRAFHFDVKNIPFWRDYDSYVSGKSDHYPENPYRESSSDFSWSVRNSQWTLHYYTGDQSYELYRASDISEETNLAVQHPDVVASMKQDMLGWIKKSARPVTENNQKKFDRMISGMQ
ncbi:MULTISPECIES: sulfatase-like hydrolase/transferase [Enterobacterales]|uniref:sulfatase-like hydrolase/transferase n=1 Tax=Enterobacterales TaxID=91347 RepID=UPI002ED7B310